MWKKLSLRFRLSILLSAMLLTALVASAVVLIVFARKQLIEENEGGIQLANHVANALNSALDVAANPEAVLNAFGRMLNQPSNDPVKYVAAGTGTEAARKAAYDDVTKHFPQWFIDLIVSEDLTRAYAVRVGGEHVGDLVYIPDLKVHLHEKWSVMRAIFATAFILAIVSLLVAYLAIGATLRPLSGLVNALNRLRAGEYSHRLSSDGPPELRQSLEGINELAKRLTELEGDNRTLMRQLLSVQDDERKALSRELHDELGPVLFAIRANAGALLEVNDGSLAKERLLAAVEGLQQVNKNILNRLRPMSIQELGLARSLWGLIDEVQAQTPHPKISADISDTISNVENVVAETAFRITQEALTNALRHSQATELSVTARLNNSSLTIEIADNGVGFKNGGHIGRGLTGMRERVLALGGEFFLKDDDSGIVVICRLPQSPG